jgi:hypothetical protein
VLRPASLVPVSERLDERHVQLDQPRAGALVPTVSVGVQQAAGRCISFAAESFGRTRLRWGSGFAQP